MLYKYSADNWMLHNAFQQFLQNQSPVSLKKNMEDRIAHACYSQSTRQQTLKALAKLARLGNEWYGEPEAPMQVYSILRGAISIT